MNEEIKKMNAYGDKLRQDLRLHFFPQAIKMVSSLDEVPEDAIWPKRDLGKHVALCQGIAMAKRDAKTVFLQKEDEWCWNPLIGLGYLECEPGTDSFNLITSVLGIQDPDAAAEFFAKFPRLPLHKYIGMLVAPLDRATFVPDLVLINCNPVQLRLMVLGIKSQTGTTLDTTFDGIDSCIWSIVVPMLKQEYRVTIPDPGDYERACAEEDELILSVPYAKLDELMTGMEATKFMASYDGQSRSMELDFSRPPFYNELFKMWGLDVGPEWKMPPMPEEE